MSGPVCPWHRQPMKWKDWADNPQGGFWTCQNKAHQDGPAREYKGTKYCNYRPPKGTPGPDPQKAAQLAQAAGQAVKEPPPSGPTAAPEPLSRPSMAQMPREDAIAAQWAIGRAYEGHVAGKIKSEQVEPEAEFLLDMAYRLAKRGPQESPEGGDPPF